MLCLNRNSNPLKTLYRNVLDYIEEITTGCADIILVNSSKCIVVYIVVYSVYSVQCIYIVYSVYSVYVVYIVYSVKCVYSVGCISTYIYIYPLSSTKLTTKLTN